MLKCVKYFSNSMLFEFWEIKLVECMCIVLFIVAVKRKLKIVIFRSL